MATALLSIDLNALALNWQALHALSANSTETAAVVKADGYGLGAAAVSAALAKLGVESFFVAAAEEGAAVREACPSATVYVFSGYMEPDANHYREFDLIPLLNCPLQLQQWQSDMGGRRYALQLDSGMNRLGFEADELATVADRIDQADLLISHLACADEPDHPMNSQQLSTFHELTDDLVHRYGMRRSLAATGGTLLGKDYHFDLVRPGIGLYGGMPFATAKPVIQLTLPVIQTRLVRTGEAVGYGAAWYARRDTRVATLAAGYADGLIRAMGNVGVAGAAAAADARIAGPISDDNTGDKEPENSLATLARGSRVSLYADGVACPLIGRVSMDMVTVDVTALDSEPESLELINAEQGIDSIAAAADTIGYEILTSCGARYQRQYQSPE